MLRSHFARLTLCAWLACVACGQAKADEAQLLWDLGLADQFPNLISSQIDSAASTIVETKAPYASALERDLARQTYFYTLHPPAPASALCKGSAGFKCCRSLDGTSFSPTYDCLLHVSLGSGSDLASGLAREGFYENLIRLLAQELAASSTLLTSTALQTGAVPPDALLYRWREDASPELHGQVLLTRIDGRLTDRLATNVAMLMPKIRVAAGSTAPGNIYLCTPAGLRLTPSSWAQLSPGPSLVVSRGVDVGIRRPHDDHAVLASSVRVGTVGNSTAIQLLPEPHPAIGGANGDLIAYFGLLTAGGSRVYGCFGDEDRTKQFGMIRNQLNSEDGSTLFFDLLYLQAVWATEGFARLAKSTP